jgi:membrane-bound ClpP family serine protease
MSREYWTCLGLMIVGFLLFLYGANYYNAVVGWAGVYVFIFGVIAALAVYICRELKKKGNQNA